MSDTCTTSPCVQPPFIYGQVLQRSLYLAEFEEQYQPGIGTYVSQGAAAGAIVLFAGMVVAILRVDAYYSILFPKALPEFLALGIGIGIYMGLLIWACARLTNRRLGIVARALLSVCGYIILQIGLRLFYPQESQKALQLGWGILLSFLLSTLPMSLVIGSRLLPWRVLTRGSESSSLTTALVARTSGFVLRLATIFFLMESVLVLIVAVRWQAEWRDIGYLLVGLGHCLFSLIIIFSRLKFVWLSLLAFVANTPVVWLFSLLRLEDWLPRYIICGYLLAWGLFLLSRSKLVDAALKPVDEEIRYYLID